MVRIARWAAAFAVAGFFTTAQAQQGVCKEDVDKLCKDVQPGEGRILKCLKTNEAQVSPACKKHLKEVQAEIKKVSAACESDIEQFCFETPMGKGAIAKCLKSNEANLSPDCKSAMEAAKAKSSKKK